MVFGLGQQTSHFFILIAVVNPHCDENISAVQMIMLKIEFNSECGYWLRDNIIAFLLELCDYIIAMYVTKWT